VGVDFADALEFALGPAVAETGAGPIEVIAAAAAIFVVTLADARVAFSGQEIILALCCSGAAGLDFYTVLTLVLAGAVDAVVVDVAARLVITLITFSARGATCLGCSEAVGLDFNAAPELAFVIAVLAADYLGDVWNQGCVEFELASLAIAGINAAGAGKLA
jgi:hypothetical protein